jgi:hypothetical protein
MTLSTPLSLSAAKRAWGRLCSSGTPTREAARALSVGLEDYLDEFDQRYLGPDGVDACKLVLGANGEGKTHFLYCVRERALERGHLVALVEAKNAGAADSPFTFGVALMRALEVGTVQGDEESDQNPLLRLLEASIERRREILSGQGLEAEELLPEWVTGIRTKNLQPNELPRALADGLNATLQGDIEGAVDAAERLSLEGAKLTKKQQEVTGAALLKSISRLPKLLGFQRLVLLVDEAELAVEGGGKARRANFLAFLRFVNDHVAQDGSIVLIACTDDFWPSMFANYAALRSRLADPGCDRLEDRKSLSTKALVTKQKLWVRETFRGRAADHMRLGEAILQIGAIAQPEMNPEVQRENAGVLAEVAASGEVFGFIKRPYVKALGQLVEEQLSEGTQAGISAEEARRRFDLARESITETDSAEDQ